MPWDCDMELLPGDLVVHTFMEREDIVNIEVENEPGELYRLMPYDDIYVARRGDNIIPLNGYCLCEEVEKESMSKILDIVEEDPINRNVGRIAYIGKKNRSYRNGETGKARDLDGNQDIKVGDVVVKRRSDIHIRLEEDLHARFFNNKVMYFIMQRKDMMGIKSE
jgi:hypothetical protein